MEATSNAFPGVPVQVFLRNLAFSDNDEQIPREFVHRGEVGIRAIGGEKGAGDRRWGCDNIPLCRYQEMIIN